MGNRRSWANAHSPYWSLHVEAWRQSGLSCMEYCCRHGLKRKTFARWMKHLVGVDEARRHAEERRELRRKERRQPELEAAPPAARPRRNFTDAEKHAIVLETEQPG